MSEHLRSPFPDLLTAGAHALEHGEWQTARDCFTAALERAESAETLEYLGLACWWLNDAPAVFHARERAYRLYREQGDQRGAARMAICIALDYYLFRGEEAVVNGWFQLAHRLLADVEPCPEHAILDIWEGYVVLMARNDVDTARRLSAQATELARSLGVIDYEMLAQALNGFALVSSDELDQGMRLLDGATTTAMAGDMTDLDAIVTTCCFLIYACERVRDYDRALQWCDMAREISERWNYRFMFSFCQVHYAAVLIWRGDWIEAEEKLLEATRDLSMTHPAMAGEGITRLADLRRRQGRLDEAAALLRQADTHPMRMSSSNYALLGRAALALDQGDPVTAAELAERFLRRIHTEDRLECLAALEVLVQAHAALGRHRHAADTLGRLRAVSSGIPTLPLQASVNFSEGIVAAAGGNNEVARQHFEDAADLFRNSGAPYETARACLALANILAELGRVDAAASEARAALETFRQIGADGEANRTETFLRQIESVQHIDANGIQPLTKREIEVLHLVAQGMTDKELALTLSLSEHTVHRHVANILTRLDVSSRAAAVAHAARNGLI